MQKNAVEQRGQQRGQRISRDVVNVSPGSEDADHSRRSARSGWSNDARASADRDG
jgi:hypothetical protein